MAKQKRIKLFSNSDVAKKLNLSAPRLRVLAVEYGLGQLVGGSMIFTQSDIDLLRKRNTRSYQYKS